MMQKQFFFGVFSGGFVTGLGVLGFLHGLFGPALTVAGGMVILVNLFYRLMTVRPIKMKGRFLRSGPVFDQMRGE